MATERWKGAAGFAKTASDTATATPKVFPIAESIDDKSEPETYERVTSQQPDVLNVRRAGFNHTIETTGMQPSCHDLSYLLWLALGGQAYTTIHTLTPTNDPLFFNYKIDKKLDLGSGNTTMEFAGCKAGNITVEQPLRNYASVAFSATACGKGAASASLAVTPPTDADNQPLDWSSLAAGFLKLGYNAVASAQDNTVQSFKVSFERALKPAGYKLNTSQPSAVNSGGRKIMVELTREFYGTEAQVEYQHWLSANKVEFDAKWVVGAHHLRIHIPQMEITGSYASPIGAGEDSIMATLVCTAVKPDGADICTIESVDDTVAVYT